MRWLAGHFGEVVDGEALATNEKPIDEFWAGTDGEDEDVAEAEVEAEEVAQTGERDVGGIPHGDARQGAGRSGTPDEEGVARGHSSRGVFSRGSGTSPGRLGGREPRPSRAAPAGRATRPERRTCSSTRICCARPRSRTWTGTAARSWCWRFRIFSTGSITITRRGRDELPAGIDVGKYVASGVYVVDLETLKLRWHTHLDLSTDSVTFRAYAYSSPRWWI